MRSHACTRQLFTKSRHRGRKKGDLHRDEADRNEKPNGSVARRARKRRAIDEPAHNYDERLDDRVQDGLLVEVQTDHRTTRPCRLEASDEVRRPVQRVHEPDGDGVGAGACGEEIAEGYECRADSDRNERMRDLTVSVTGGIEEPFDPVGCERDWNEQRHWNAGASAFRDHRERDVANVQSARPSQKPVQPGHPDPRRDHGDADRDPLPVQVNPSRERRKAHDGRIR